MQLNEDSLKAGDLQGLVEHIFEIDSYKSKMGDDQDIVVLSFVVLGKEPAKDLVSFVEKGHSFVLDADYTPGELSDGKYRVFIELERDRKVVSQIVDMLYGIKLLTGLPELKFRYYKSFDSRLASEEELAASIPVSPEEYVARRDAHTLESYAGFFSKSLVESVSMADDVITFSRAYAGPIKMRYIGSGPTKAVLDLVEGRVKVEYKDMAEVMFLTKYLGNYNISKLGERFMFENAGYAVLLERIL